MVIPAVEDRADHGGDRDEHDDRSPGRLPASGTVAAAVQALDRSLFVWLAAPVHRGAAAHARARRRRAVCSARDAAGTSGKESAT